MEKAGDLIKISETATKYRPWWDVAYEKVAYILILFGSFLWVFYLAKGGDIINCYPLLKCPSQGEVSYNKSNVRRECEGYRNMKGHGENQSFSVIVHFKSIHQYQFTNTICSEQLQGSLFVTGPFLVLIAFYLLISFRLWYFSPLVEAHLNSLHRLVIGSTKLPHWKMLSDSVDAWNALSVRTTNNCNLSINDAWMSRENSLPSSPLDNVDTRVLDAWEQERKEYFHKRRKLLNTISSFYKEEIQQMELFHRQMGRWRAQLNPRVQLWYKYQQIMNMALLFFVTLLMFVTVRQWDSLLSDDAICKTELNYDINYNQIKCHFSGSILITFICAFALFFLLFTLLLSITITIFYMGCTKQQLKYQYLKFYGFLSWMQSESCKKTLSIFDEVDDSYFRQIVTDSMYPLNRVDCHMGDSSKRMSYIIEGAKAPVPSCLFSETVDSQEWCLEIQRVTGFQDSDFIGFNWLIYLKELNLSSCFNICCLMESHWIRKLQMVSCTIQNRLLICDEGHEVSLGDLDQSCWRFPSLETLVITDPRPFRHLSLRFRTLSELFLSNVMIDQSLEDLPDVKHLTLKSCRIRKEIAILRRSHLLASLTVNACNIRYFPTLDCPNLRSLDLSENRICLAEEFNKSEETQQSGAGHEVYTVQNLPNLEKLFLSDNQITSLDFHILEKLKLRKGLQVLDVRNNPLEREKVLSDISILYVFTSQGCVSNVLDMEKYGNYLIENEESEFPSFIGCHTALVPQVAYDDQEKSLSSENAETNMAPDFCSSYALSRKYIPGNNAALLQDCTRLQSGSKLAIIYCDVRHDPTRRRLMLYISCIVQLLYRNHNFSVRDAGDVTYVDIADLQELHIYLALRPNGLHSTVRKLQRLAESARNRGVCVVTMCEIEYGESQTTQETLEDIDSCFGGMGPIIRNCLQDFPIFKSSSVFRQVALKLKKGQCVSEIINQLHTLNKF